MTPHTNSASTLGCRRTALRRICKHFLLNIPGRWHLVYLWSDVIIRRQSVRSTYSAEMRREPLLGTVHGILAAQLIRPQAKVLANDRGISCVTIDYDLLRGLDSADDRLF